MARINELTAATPGKDNVIVVDGEGGTHKVPLGDLAGLVNVKGIAGFHNSIYRGANLKERWGISDDKAIADEVARRIADGSFDDLFVGDWWSATITTEFGTETVEIVLAGFDVYWHSMDNYLEQHHAVCVTRNCLNTAHRMNATHTTVGAYEGCEMHKTTLPKYATAFQAVLNGHLMTVDDSVSCNMEADIQNVNVSWLKGAADDWETASLQLSLLSEAELFGQAIYTAQPCSDFGYNNRQLPLFRLNPAMIPAQKAGISYWYWLKSIASAQSFCYCYDGGGAGYGSAASTLGVRPHFLIG